MISLTRLNHVPLVLNSDLIEHIEVTPDTVITLVSGQKIMVRETAAEIIRKVTEFRRSIYQNSLRCPAVRHIGGGEDLLFEEPATTSHE